MLRRIFNAMPNKTIVFFELEDWEAEFLRRHVSSDAAEFTSEQLQVINASQYKDAEVISTFIYSELGEPALQQFPKLKMIATRSTGYDHIALQYCKDNNITVANVPSYGDNTVAEHTFALILSLSRNVHKAYVRMKSRGTFSFDGLQGFDLKDKTIGVVGAGHIGMHVIKIARGFSMDVLAFDLNKSSFLQEVLGFTYVDMDTLLSRSDIVSLHAPYNSSTHHMINVDNIHLMKKGSLIINTSRGGLVQTEALLKGLDEGILAGVGLDVLEGERIVKEEREILTKNYTAEELKILITNHMLMNRDNVIITPHIGFNSREAVMRILETTRDNIEAYLEGKPQNVVSK